MTYNLSKIMSSANTYAKTMSHGTALRRAWRNAKLHVEVDVLQVPLNDLRQGDNVAIAVGALWGDIRWYRFDHIDRDYNDSESVVIFKVTDDYTIDFVIEKDAQFIVEREVEVITIQNNTAA